MEFRNHMNNRGECAMPRNKWTVYLIACAIAALIVVPAIAGDTEEVVKRGEEIGKSPEVSINDVIKEPAKYVGKSMILTGEVQEVCQKKGCWMEVVSGDPQTRVRVTFKDYGFFVPMDCHGWKVKAEGMFEKKTLSKEDADHLAEEGAHIVRNADGTATEIAFVASGVEMIPVKQEETEPEETEPEEAEGDES